MKKFFASAFIVLALLFCSSFVLAANTNLGDELNATKDKTTSTISNMGSTVMDNMHMNNNNNNDNNTNGITNTTANNTGTNTGNNNGNYTATRTGTMTSATGDNTWTWVILAIAAIMIIALVWYYAAQNNSSSSMNED